jgi:hypothetical protein
MQREQAKLLLATGDHTAAEDGHQQALAVVRRQSAKFWTPPVSGAARQRYGGSSPPAPTY